MMTASEAGTNFAGSREPVLLAIIATITRRRKIRIRSKKTVLQIYGLTPSLNNPG
jgi:hypothetical protein